MFSIVFFPILIGQKMACYAPFTSKELFMSSMAFYPVLIGHTLQYWPIIFDAVLKGSSAIPRRIDVT